MPLWLWRNGLDSVEKQRKSRARDATPDILERIALGNSVTSACRANGIAISTFLERVAKDSELAERYARVRQSCADAQAEEMHDLENQVLRGELDPQSFRVVMDARKWRLAKMHPRSYGDKVTLQGDTQNPLAFTVVSGIEHAPGIGVESTLPKPLPKSDDVIDAEVMG